MPSASCNSRSRITRLVTLSPSVPASGLSLTEIVIARVGGSIGCACSGSSTSSAAERVGDGGLLQPGDGDDVARFGLARSACARCRGRREFSMTRPCSTTLPSAVQHLDRRVGLDRAGYDAAGDDAAQIWIGFQHRASMRKPPAIDFRRLGASEHEVEQRGHVLVRIRRANRPSTPCLAEAVDDGKIELLVGGIQRGEQIEALRSRLRSGARRACRPC